MSCLHVLSMLCDTLNNSQAILSRSLLDKRAIICQIGHHLSGLLIFTVIPSFAISQHSHSVVILKVSETINTKNTKNLKMKILKSKMLNLNNQKLWFSGMKNLFQQNFEETHFPMKNTFPLKQTSTIHILQYVSKRFALSVRLSQLKYFQKKKLITSP